MKLSVCDADAVFVGWSVSMCVYVSVRVSQRVWTTQVMMSHIPPRVHTPTATSSLLLHVCVLSIFIWMCGYMFECVFAVCVCSYLTRSPFSPFIPCCPACPTEASWNKQTKHEHLYHTRSILLPGYYSTLNCSIISQRENTGHFYICASKYLNSIAYICIK